MRGLLLCGNGILCILLQTISFLIEGQYDDFGLVFVCFGTKIYIITV